MSDKAKVIAGLVGLLVIGTFPIWFTLAASGEGLRELDSPEGVGQEECVEGDMAARHMDLLDEWRDAVVRGELPDDRYSHGHDGALNYTSEDYGTEWEGISLTRTCMNCHTSRSGFCDRCHNYADVNPYCWDCHIEPEQIQSYGQE